MLGRLFSFLTNAALAAIVFGAAIPGTHRVALPAGYGLSRIAPRVWTDAPGRAAEFLELIEQSRARVVAFFGDATRPNIILCSTKSCARRFGIGGNGLSIANFAVMAGPGGLTRGTMTHELTHSRLHRSMGPGNLLRQPYPTWFDEGLATHVAGHPVWRGNVSEAVRARVLSVRRFWNWDDAYRELGVRRAYGTAAAEVARIERIAGRAGLVELITRTEVGEDFDKILAELLQR